MLSEVWQIVKTCSRCGEFSVVAGMWNAVCKETKGKTNKLIIIKCNTQNSWTAVRTPFHLLPKNWVDETCCRRFGPPYVLTDLFRAKVGFFFFSIFQLHVRTKLILEIQEDLLETRELKLLENHCKYSIMNIFWI